MQLRLVSIGSFHIVLDPSALATFRRWKQPAHAAEACGILLGMQWPVRWEVTEATSPQPSDRRGRFHYVREVDGHLDIARQRWEESAGLIGYLGEWHTHPQSCAQPSGTDLRETAALSRRNGFPVLSIVVGRSRCTAFVMDEGRLVGMQPFDLG